MGAPAPGSSPWIGPTASTTTGASAGPRRRATIARPSTERPATMRAGAGAARLGGGASASTRYSPTPHQSIAVAA